ncbi:hypothetical protein RRG08_062615 [Elysia crispata]|uniref:Uncharacterized protein n=1 Tax=Elysia crispata TaxID=231223 RepID=A0AAE0YYI7_9GAST|nr:hypothetical protein RRG08_062615 [Elysia crispata]
MRGLASGTEELNIWCHGRSASYTGSWCWYHSTVKVRLYTCLDCISDISEIVLSRVEVESGEWRWVPPSLTDAVRACHKRLYGTGTPVRSSHLSQVLHLIEFLSDTQSLESTLV